MKRRFALGLLLTPLVPHARGCLWDSETLEMEKRRFPGLHEVITGRFYRHGRAFYEWRLRDRTARFQREPGNLALLDDIAVSHDKLGDQEKAIQVMRGKERMRPGMYETTANLGTFLIHAGKLKEGLELIRVAIRINPNAHFGREIWQARVVEYLLARRGAGHEGLPLAETKEAGDLLYEKFTFFDFLVEQGHLKKEALLENALAQAQRGVSGMMFFGDHRSPVLLECLSYLLSAEPSANRLKDFAHLAATALLKAGIEAKDEAARARYERMAVERLRSTFLPDVRDKLFAEWKQERLREFAEAREWSAALEAKEEEWIRTGLNPETEFNRLRDDARSGKS